MVYVISFTVEIVGQIRQGVLQPHLAGGHGLGHEVSEKSTAEHFVKAATEKKVLFVKYNKAGPNFFAYKGWQCYVTGQHVWQLWMANGRVNGA
jgi:hypothetical protein